MSSDELLGEVLSQLRSPLDVVTKKGYDEVRHARDDLRITDHEVLLPNEGNKGFLGKLWASCVLTTQYPKIDLSGLD